MNGRRPVQRWRVPEAYEAEAVYDVDDTDRRGPSMRNLLHVMLRRKWWALGFFALCLAAAWAYSQHAMRPMYKASAQILVSPGREHVSDMSLPTAGAVPPTVRFNPEEQIARAKEILTGRFLAERVVGRLGVGDLFGRPDWAAAGSADPALQEAAVNLFLKRVSAEGARSGIVTLGFLHEDPRVAAEALNLLADTYVERYVGLQQDPRSDAFFQAQFGALKGKLAQSEARFLQFKERHGIARSLDEEQEAVRQQQSMLRGELNEVRGRSAELNSRGAELRRQIAEHGSLYGTLQADLQRTAADLKAARAREATVAGRLAQLQGRLDALERLRDEYNRLDKQAQADEDDYRRYAVKAEASRLAGAMDEQRLVGVRVIERAEPPALPLPLGRARGLLLGAGLGLIGGLAVAFAVHALARTVDTAEDVERQLDLPVLASLPVHAARGAPRAWRA